MARKIKKVSAVIRHHLGYIGNTINGLVNGQRFITLHSSMGAV